MQRGRKLVLGFSIAPLIWGIYTLVKTGQLFPNMNHLNIAYEAYGRGNMTWDQFWWGFKDNFPNMWAVVTHDVLDFVSMLGTNLFEHVWEDITRLVGVVAIGIVILFLQRAKPTKFQWSYVAIGACFFLGLVPVFYGERFSLPLLPIYAGVGIWGIYRMTNERWRTLALGLVLVVTAAMGGVKAVKHIQSGPEYVLPYQGRLPETAPEGAVMARKPHIAYYLDREFVSWPLVDSYDLLRDSIRARKVDYLFYSGIEASTRPAFRNLMNERPPWLVPVAGNDFSVLFAVQLPPDTTAKDTTQQEVEQ
jgi:hypothetical protein